MKPNLFIKSVAIILVPFLVADPALAHALTAAPRSESCLPTGRFRVPRSVFTEQAFALRADVGVHPEMLNNDQEVKVDKEISRPTRRGFLRTTAAGAALAALTTMPSRADTLSPQKEAQDSAVSQAIAKELSSYRQDLSKQEKNLPPRIFAMVRKALNEYFEILPEDKSARDVITRAMNRLQDDLFEDDYLFDWRIDTPVLGLEGPTARSTIYELKPQDREIVELQVKGRVVRVAVYPKRVASGENPYFWVGKAFPKRNLVLVDEDNVHGERMRLLSGPSFEADFGVNETIGQEAMRGLCCPPPVVSRDELESMIRQDAVAHEVLHVYFELLYPGKDNMSNREADQDDRRNELASYLGELALAKYPYVNLLFRLRDLKAASSTSLFGGPVVIGHIGESAEEIFRGLARELGGRFKRRKDRRLARKIARGSRPVSVKQAASLFEALLRDRQTISEQDIRTSARKMYEARIGSFVDDFKPVAHLFPSHSIQDVFAASVVRPLGSNPSNAGPAKLKRVLVVDDMEAMRTLFAQILTPNGYEVVTVEDGPAALQKLENQTFDLMITDLNLGEKMHGPELVDEARQRQPWLRTLLTSGANVVVEMAQRRDSPSLQKPFAPKALLEAIEKLIPPQEASLFALFEWLRNRREWVSFPELLSGMDPLVIRWDTERGLAILFYLGLLEKSSDPFIFYKAVQPPSVRQWMDLQGALKDLDSNPTPERVIVAKRMIRPSLVYNPPPHFSDITAIKKRLEPYGSGPVTFSDPEDKGHMFVLMGPLGWVVIVGLLVAMVWPEAWGGRRVRSLLGDLPNLSGIGSALLSKVNRWFSWSSRRAGLSRHAA